MNREAYMSYKNRLENLRRLHTGTEVPMTPLLSDFTCAVFAGSPKILHQGRMYITFSFIYFYCRLLKYEHKILIHFNEIVELTKEKTVLVFPNAIQIVTTNDERHFFTSFTARDRTFHIINKLWLEHKSGVQLSTAAIWDRVRLNYGHDLGFTSEDPEYEDSKETLLNARYTIRRQTDASDTLSQDDSIYESFEDSISNDSREDLSAVNILHKRTNGVKINTNYLNLIMEDESKLDLLMGDNSRGKSLKSMSLPSAVKIPRIEKPLEPAICKGHDHLPMVTLDEEFNLNVKTLWTFLFTDSAFYRALSAMRMIVDVKQSGWSEEKGTNGDMSRTIQYTVNLKNRFGPKQSPTIESQVRLAGSQENHMYFVECTARTVGIPLSDSFHLVFLYCLLYVSPTRSRLKVSMKIVYDKSVFFATKSIIESTVKSNCLDYNKDLKNSLINESKKISTNCLEEKVYPSPTCIEDTYNDPTAETFVESSHVNNATNILDENKVSWMTMVIICCGALLLLYIIKERFSGLDPIPILPTNQKESPDSSLTDIMNLIQEMKTSIEMLKNNIEILNKPSPCLTPVKSCPND